MVVGKSIFFSNIIFTTFCLIFVHNLQAQKLSDHILNHFHYREIGRTRQGGRVVAFAVSKQDPYVFFVGAGPGGLWKTVNNGLSFEAIFDRENSSTIGDVAVAPSDDKIVWVGTGEANLRNSTYHGDGVYKSTDGGMQDFGSWKGPSTKKGRFPFRFEDWEHIQGGDGFYNLVDPINSRWLYSESQFGDLARIDQKTGVRKRIAIKDQLQYRFNWNTPILISPHNSNVIYQGANVVLRSTFRGEKWEVINPDLTKNDSTKFGDMEN